MAKERCWSMCLSPWDEGREREAQNKTEPLQQQTELAAGRGRVLSLAMGKPSLSYKLGSGEMTRELTNQLVEVAGEPDSCPQDCAWVGGCHSQQVSTQTLGGTPCGQHQGLAPFRPVSAPPD